MYTLAFQSIQVHGKGSHQGFTLAGTHFSDATGMQGHTANQLHVKMTHAHNPFTSFAHYRKGFRQKLVQALSIHQALTKLTGFLL